MFRKSHLSLAVSAVLGFGALGAAPTAVAQDGELEEVIVTGSLIRNPNLTRSAPVNVISNEEMEFQSISVVEEILREVPGAVPSVGANVNNGNGGFSYVNLRGLGSNRNVVLIDGNRFAPSELNGRFDLNNVPSALVERIDVLTGGASTTYGADAIAGVVNFVLKKDFEGLEVNTSWGQTAEGDGEEYGIEITVGSDFADGRGNAVLSMGIQDVEPVFQGDREFSENVLFYWNGAAGGSGLGSYNTRIGNVNPTGTDNGNLSLGGVQDDRTFASAFTPYNYAPWNAFQTPLKRYNFFTAINYEINDRVEVYANAMFNENTVRTLIAPSGSFGDSVKIALNHPYLSDAQRNALCAFDTNPAEGTYEPLYTQAQCDAAGAATGPSDPNYLEVDSELRRRNVEGGPRISDFVATYFNYSLGFRGDINDNIGWDVMASYGKSDQVQTQKGYWLKSRFRQSLLSGPNGCNDSTGGCLPVDFFGPTGSITTDMNDFLAGGESNITTVFDMTQVKAYVNGETNVTIPMADNPINFAVGAEYRKYRGSRASDLLSQSGDLGGSGGAQPNINGSYSVKELVAEVAVPVIQGKRFVEDLTGEAGYRRSEYSIDSSGGASFSTDTWKLGLSWTPIQDLMVRTTFARAVRAPNIAEMFEPVTTYLGNLTNDPCASVDDDGVNSGFVPTGALREVCIAQGAPANTIGYIPQPAAGQVNVTGGGNLNLGPEESDSYTLGFVIQPSAVPDLVVTIDYYDITIDKSIENPTEDDVIALCFDNPSTSNPACSGIVRSSINGGLSGDILAVKGLPLALSNTGNLATKGVDFSVKYAHDLGPVMWSSSLVGNWTDTSTYQAVTGVSLDRECVGLYSSNCSSIQPDYAFNWRNTFTYDKLDVSLNWRHIAGAEYENAATDKALIGVPSGKPSLGSQNFNKTDDYSLFDLTLRYTITDNITVTGVISNLLDEEPELTGAFIGQTGYNSGNTYPSTYDTLGRRYNLSAKFTF